MPKRATAMVEEMSEGNQTGGSESMERRKRLAKRIRLRMAKPATPEEQELWQELKAEVSERRLTFRS